MLSVMGYFALLMVESDGFGKPLDFLPEAIVGPIGFLDDAYLAMKFFEKILFDDSIDLSVFVIFLLNERFGDKSCYYDVKILAFCKGR